MDEGRLTCWVALRSDGKIAVNLLEVPGSVPGTPFVESIKTQLGQDSGSQVVHRPSEILTHTQSVKLI